MGTWDTGLFDNDSAADFASEVEHSPDTAARQELLRTAMEEFIGMKGPVLDPEYSYGYQTEQAFAAVGFVADAKTGRRDFTETSYAMTLVDQDNFQEREAWDYIEIGTPSPVLVETAVKAASKGLRLMKKYEIDEEWREPLGKALSALQEG